MRGGVGGGEAALFFFPGLNVLQSHTAERLVGWSEVRLNSKEQSTDISEVIPVITEV